MMVRVRRQPCLMISLSITGFLLLLVLSIRPLQPTKPVVGGGEIGFLRRRIAYDDSGGATAVGAPPDFQQGSPIHPTLRTTVKHSSAPQHTSVHLTEKERKNLARQGILLVEDDDDDVTANGPPEAHQPHHQEQQGKHLQQQTQEQHLPEQGVQHDEWLKQIEFQHEEYIRRQHRLQNQHLLEAQLLQQKLQEEEEKQQLSSSISVVSRMSQVSENLAGTGNGPISYRKPGAPPLYPITYDSLKKQGETILLHTLKREFMTTKKDTNFTPGEVVKPSQVRRVIIVSTWRSGSSYLGDLLRAYPGTFYSFEPLHHLLKNQHLQEGPLVETVVNHLRGILTCDYSHLDDYINYMRNNTFLIDHNTRFWNSCIRNRALCFDKEYLSKLCKYMPVNVLKTVRMGLSPVVELLQDPSLDLRVIHLVRDPRGSLHSRMQLSWCLSQVCSDPATVCKDLLTDLTLSDWMKQNFPERFLTVRYEDMGLQPEEKAREIFKFLQLSYNKYVATFVKEHTKPSRKTKRNNNTYSTFRDSKATTFAWRGALNYTSVEAIQDVCVEPLHRLRLRIFENEEEYLNTTLPVLLDA